MTKIRLLGRISPGIEASLGISRISVVSAVCLPDNSIWFKGNKVPTSEEINLFPSLCLYLSVSVSISVSMSLSLFLLLLKVSLTATLHSQFFFPYR